MTTLTKNQTKTFGPKLYVEHGTTYRITAIVHYDDQCGNGHNTFSITGQIDEKRKNGTWNNFVGGGCIHEEIAKHFPELKPFIKWHLVSSDGPLHYLANTLYHAQDKDCHGLRKDEKRQIRNGKTGKLCWILEDNTKLEKYVDSDTKPEGTIVLKYEPWYRIGEGKEPDIKAARSSAVWPDATLEQLQSKEALKARLPDLMAEFRKDVESLGFIY